MSKNQLNLKLFFLTSITLFFFSTSSLLGRAALLNNSIDPFSFTFFRLFFAATTLFLIIIIKEKKFYINLTKNWLSAFSLFLYAITFSYAYIKLDAGIGALILFAIVQLLLIIIALLKGEKITKLKFLGICLAFFGLFYLLVPSDKISLPFFEVFLMAISGIAWAFYTLFGKNTLNAFLHTGDNFIKSLVFALFFYFLFVQNTNISAYGVFLAFLSGGITSSLGYGLWYYILPQISTINSGVLQLIVPPLSIILGIIFLNEILTFKLIMSTSLILIGVFISIYKKSKV